MSDSDRIMVGYDGSPASAAALRWATDEAVRRGARLRIAYVLSIPLAASPMGVAVRQLRTGGLICRAEQLLETVCGRVRADHPSLWVDGFVGFGSPGQILLQESSDAMLVVLGADRRSRVTQRLAKGSDCPVVVVPRDWDGSPLAEPARNAASRS